MEADQVDHDTKEILYITRLEITQSFTCRHDEGKKKSHEPSFPQSYRMGSTLISVEQIFGGCAHTATQQYESYVASHGAAPTD